MYLYLSRRYRHYLPFKQGASPDSGGIFVPEPLIKTSSHSSPTHENDLECAIAILTHDQIECMKRQDYYGFRINGHRVELTSNEEALCDWIDAKYIFHQSPSPNSAETEACCATVDMANIQNYVYHAIGSHLDLDFLSAFIHRAFAYMNDLTRCATLRSYDTLLWFDMFTEQALGIGAYCLATSKSSIEIAHGSFFSAYGHSKHDSSPAVPNTTLDPYGTLQFVFGRFYAHRFMNPAISSKRTLNSQLIRHWPPSDYQFELIKNTKDVERLNRLANCREFDFVYVIDNGDDDRSSPWLPILAEVLLMRPFRRCAFHGRLAVVAHPRLQCSVALQQVLEQIRLPYQTFRGISGVVQSLSRRGAVDISTAFVTFTESASWREILTCTSITHIHVGGTPLGSYLDNLWKPCQ